MKWIIGFLVVLVIWACMEVGLLYSILAIGIVCGTLAVIYALQKKAAQNDATPSDKTIAKTSQTIVIVIAFGLIFVGAIAGLVGILNPQTDGYKMETCGWCGGDGIIDESHKRCSVCNGAGGAVFENTVYFDGTFIGILLAASGAVLFLGTKMLQNAPNSTPKQDNKDAVQIDIPVGTCSFWLGHWKDGISNSTWIINQPDSSGAWGIRLRFIYTGVESFKQSYYFLIPYDKNGNPLASEHRLSCSNYLITPDTTHIVSWTGLWNGKEIDHIKVTKIEIIHGDGESQVFDV